MSKQGHISGSGHGLLGAASVRLEPVNEDDRPFAEIRRNLLEAVRLLSLHRWAFFVPFSIVASTAFILSLYYPRTYVAKTSFERRNDPILADLSMSPGTASFALFRTTIARDLTSVECMAEVVEKIGLTRDFPRNDDGTLTPASIRRRNALALSLGERINLTTRRPNDETDIVEITYTGPDPEIGKKVLDEVKATYIRQTMASVQKHLEGLHEYYVAETEESATQLKGVQREETGLRLANPDVNPQNPGSISAKLAQLEMERHELSRRRREYQADLDAFEQMRAELESRTPVPATLPDDVGPKLPEIPLSAEAMRLARLMAEVTGKIEQLRSVRGMTDEHPEIQELHATHRHYQSELAALPRPPENSIVVNEPLTANGVFTVTVPGIVTDPWAGERTRLMTQIAAQEAKIKEVAISLESNERETARLAKAKESIYDLQEAYADVDTRVIEAQRRYNQLATTLAKVEPAIKANQQNKLLHWSMGPPARGGNTPVNPKARTVILLALLAGIATGVGFVILAEVFDRIYRSSAQVARSLGLPILDMIDEIVTAQDRRRLFLRRAVVTPLIVVACGGLMATTGSLAFLSIQRPHAYEQIQQVPRAAYDFLTGAMPAKDLPPGQPARQTS